MLNVAAGQLQVHWFLHTSTPESSNSTSAIISEFSMDDSDTLPSQEISNVTTSRPTPKSLALELLTMIVKCTVFYICIGS